MNAAVANLGTAQMCDTSRTGLRLTADVMRAARNCWSVKTRLHLAEITGYSVRACESWLACERKIPADALAALIRSEWGLEFLSSLMAESSVAWWRRLLRVNIVASVLRRRAADKRLLERALESDRDLTDTMARAATALCVQDEDFGSVFADGVRSVARPPDRTLARAAGLPAKPKARHP